MPPPTRQAAAEVLQTATIPGGVGFVDKARRGPEAQVLVIRELPARP